MPAASPKLLKPALFAFAGALLPVIALGVVSARTFAALAAASAQARHAFLVRERLEGAVAELDNVMAGAENYALTRRPEALRRYSDARAGLPDALESAIPVLRDGAAQAQRLGELGLNARLCVDLAGRVVGLAGSGSRPPDTALLAAARRAFDDARAIAAGLAREETALMREREAEAARMAGRARALTAGAVLSALALSAGAAWSLRAALRAREELTERVLASSERLQAILDNTPAIVFIKDAAGRYLFANRRMEELVGLSLSAIRGKTAADLFGPAAAAALHDHDDTVRRSRALLESEEVIPMKGGTRTFLSLKFPLPRRGGDPDLLCGIAADITERKHAERLKSEVLSLATHELRSPLTVILGTLRLALDEEGPPLAPQAGELLEMALRNARHMLALINAYLDLAALESGEGPLALADTDLRGALAETVRDFKAAAGGLGPRLRLVAGRNVALVRADPERLREVVDNLLSNAVKFSPDGAPLTVRLHRRPAAWRVSVRDRGPGIRAEFRPLVFGKFSRDKARGAGVRGTGLGLSIAKALVERMGGSIGFLTRDGVGTTFFFELPAPPAARGRHEG